jgi:hypothetical protein
MTTPEALRQTGRKEVMRVEIEIQQVIVPVGSTIGYVIGQPVGDGTKVVVAAADHRVLSAIVDAMFEADGPVIGEVPDWAILRIYETP